MIRSKQTELSDLKSTVCKLCNAVIMCTIFWISRRVWLVLFAQLLSMTLGISLGPCGDDNIFEVQENATSSLFCSSISSSSYVQWFYNNGFDIGRCNASSLKCFSYYDNIFNITMLSEAVSQLAINTSHSNFNGTRLFGNSSVVCGQYISGFTSAMCITDFVYVSKNSSCTVWYRTDTTPWTVSSNCTFPQTYSAQRRYSCQWFQKTTILPETSLGHPITMITTPIAGNKYVSGSCMMTTLMPLTEGHYTFKVMVIPGSLKVTATVIGTNEIRSPTLVPSHTCPAYVTEGSSINCTCESDDMGSPAGTLQWNETGSPRLLLENVQQNDEGKIFYCNLVWNGVSRQLVSYNLSVTYIHVVISANTQTGDVVTSEGQDVEMVCIAEGWPTPSALHLMQDSKDKSLGSVSQSSGYRTLRLVHRIQAVKCEDGGQYTCMVEGMEDLGIKTKRLMLFVSCGPRLFKDSISTNAETLEAVEGSSAVLVFDIMAFPSPDTYTLTFLDSSTGTWHIVNKSSIILSFARGDVYNRLKCIVTFMTINSEVGQYRVTVKNHFGELNYTFRYEKTAFLRVDSGMVRRCENSLDTQDKSPNPEATGRGSQPRLYEDLDQTEIGARAPYESIDMHVNSGDNARTSNEGIYMNFDSTSVMKTQL